MNQLLSDDEITLIVRECAKGSAINRDGSTSHRIARAIEAAVLAKLREQEPVAAYFTEGGQTVFAKWNKQYKAKEYGHWKPVFAHPAPIPESLLDLLAIIHRDGGHYTDEHGIDKAINDAKDKVWTMLAAARSE